MTDCMPTSTKVHARAETLRAAFHETHGEICFLESHVGTRYWRRHVRVEFAAFAHGFWNFVAKIEFYFWL